MKILIAGASGFIGKSLSRYLFDQGHTLIKLGRSTTAKGYPKTGENQNYTWKDLEQGKLDALEIDMIINLAGESVASGIWTKSRKERILTSRLNSTRALCNYVSGLPRPPAIFLQASAIGFYGTNVHAVSEPSERGSGFLAEVVERWEAEVHLPPGIRLVIMRLGVVIGEGGALGKLRMSEKLGFLLLPGDGKKTQAFIHIDDIRNFVGQVVQSSDYHGIFNLTAPKPGNFRQLLKPLKKLLIPIPSWVYQLLLGQMARETILVEQHVIPERLMQLGFTFQKPDAAEFLTRA